MAKHRSVKRRSARRSGKAKRSMRHKKSSGGKHAMKRWTGIGGANVYINPSEGRNPYATTKASLTKTVIPNSGSGFTYVETIAPANVPCPSKYNRLGPITSQAKCVPR